MVPSVLITDDDADFRSVLCEALSRRGMNLRQAGDGDEALHIIENEQVHMVLVDLHMPRMTGIEVIRQLASRACKMPYVLMSAMMDEAIEREAAQMRAYRVLHKPVRLRQLDEVVCSGLADVYGWRPAAR